MKGLAKLVIISLGFVVVPCGTAGAVTCPIVAGDLQYMTSSFGAPPTGAQVTPLTPAAGAFRTRTTATTLSMVSFAASSVLSTNGYVNVEIWSDNGAGTAPSHLIALIRRHAVVPAYTAATPVFLVSALPSTSSPAIRLSPSTTYWIVLSDASDAPVGVPVTVWHGVASATLPATTNILPGFSAGVGTPAAAWAPSAALAALTPLFEVRACA
jgi:hypothetical protein